MNSFTPKKNLKTANLTKILEVPWDRNHENLSIVVPEFNAKLMTSRNVLSYIASIYDPLGLTSASHTTGNVIYRDLCDKKRPWDTEIPRILMKKFKKWVSDITNILIPKYFGLYLDLFGDLNSEITECTMHEFCNSYNWHSLCHKST